MSQIIIDETLRGQLGQVKEQVELVDTAGQKVGYFLSPEEYERYRYALAVKEGPTPEELAAARQDYLEKGGYTTAEVLAHLANLGPKREQP